MSLEAGFLRGDCCTCIGVNGGSHVVKPERVEIIAASYPRDLSIYVGG